MSTEEERRQQRIQELQRLVDRGFAGRGHRLQAQRERYLSEHVCRSFVGEIPTITGFEPGERQLGHALRLNDSSEPEFLDVAAGSVRSVYGLSWMSSHRQRIRGALVPMIPIGTSLRLALRASAARARRRRMRSMVRKPCDHFRVAQSVLQGLLASTMVESACIRCRRCNQAKERTSWPGFN